MRTTSTPSLWSRISSRAVARLGVSGLSPSHITKMRIGNGRSGPSSVTFGVRPRKESGKSVLDHE